MNESRSPNPRLLAGALLALGLIAVVGFVAWQGSRRSAERDMGTAATETQNVLHAGATGVVRIAVEGMTCSGCAKSVANEIRKVPGVIDCRVDFDQKVAYVRVGPEEVSETALLAAVEDAGYVSRVEK